MIPLTAAVGVAAAATMRTRMEQPARSPLRLLAPAAIVTFALALVLVIATADVDEGGPATSARQAEQSDLGMPQRGSEPAGSEPGRQSRGRGVYVVKTGDTLAGIAAQTGLTVERLQELNPELDPQALVSGQRIKLRE
jgi:hypothetical protein